MNGRILIATVAALSIAGISAASAEPDSSGAGEATIGWGYGYSGGPYGQAGYMAYGSADNRIQTMDSAGVPRQTRQYRSPRMGGWCMDQDGQRFACR